jgi:hypothetical protein
MDQNTSRLGKIGIQQSMIMKPFPKLCSKGQAEQADRPEA